MRKKVTVSKAGYLSNNVLMLTGRRRADEIRNDVINLDDQKKYLTLLFLCRIGNFCVSLNAPGRMFVGLGVCLIAATLFGSVYIPIKKSPPTDGFVVQFFLCIGALLVAIVVHAIQGFPQLYPLAGLGGALWCISNSFAIQIMNRLGMALGILIWNTTSCLIGWATSRYGLFGVPKAVPESIVLNYIGVGFLILGAIMYVFVKSNPQGSVKIQDEEIQDKKQLEALDEVETSGISFQTKILFVIFALISGVFYGSMCTPVTFIQSHSSPDSLFPGAPTSGLPYVLPFFLGVFITSLTVLVVYSILHQNDQMIDGLLLIRSIFGGIMFGVGIVFFFLANEMLSPTVAYPLIAMAPGLIVSLWSVLYFREITGRRNLIILSVAYSTTLVGVAFVAISKEFKF